MSVVKQVMMMPVWILSVFTQAKYFGNNPIIGSVWLNICGLHVGRVVVSRGVYLCKQTMMSCMMPKEDRVFFRKNGYLIKENILDPEIFAQLEKEVLSYNGNFRHIKEGDTLTKRSAVTHRSAVSLPVTEAVLYSKPYFNILRYTAARNERPAMYIESITQHHGEKSKDPQKNLHKDTFHPTVKSWLYVTDVTPENGPFIYVPGSHRLTRERLRWEYKLSISRSKTKNERGGYKGGAFRVSEEDYSRLHIAQPQSFPVKKNTLIVADTFGIHCRGEATTSQLRTAIWSSSRVNPFNPFPGWNSKLLTRLRDKSLDMYHSRKQRNV